MVLGKNKASKVPLCLLKATMNGADIALSPALTDMYRYLSKAVKHLVESAKLFARWKHGSCIVSSPVVVSEGQEFTYTFYQDISKNQYIIKLMLSLNHTIQRTFGVVNRYIAGWRRYNKVYGLWDTKRETRVNQLEDINPPINYFDARLSTYERLVGSVKSQPGTKDVEFLRIDASPVIAGIAKRAEYWRQMYGSILHKISSKKMLTLNGRFNSLRDELDAETNDIDALKKLLNAVAQCDEVKLEVEEQLSDLEERFRTIRQYNVKIDSFTGVMGDGICGFYDSKEDADAALVSTSKQLNTDGGFFSADAEAIKATSKVFMKEKAGKWAATFDYNVAKKWTSLVNWGKTKDLRLVKIKDDFRVVTQKDVAEFAEHVKVVNEKFINKGPGMGGVKLADALVLMDEYGDILKTLQKKQAILVNAEKLFGLDYFARVGYPELGNFKLEMGKLGQIYGLYEEHMEFLKASSSGLWSQLDIATINEGVETFRIKVRQFPKELKELTAYKNVESVRLFVLFVAFLLNVV